MFRNLFNRFFGRTNVDRLFADYYRTMQQQERERRAANASRGWYEFSYRTDRHASTMRQHVIFQPLAA